MEITQYQLSNGLDVVLNPTENASVVAFNVWIGVGSADETPDEAGLAHVHEHMLFKGTDRRGVGQIAQEVENAGGRINAFTSFDNTCYYIVMSQRFFDTGLDILADAAQNSSFDESELERELGVIQEEIKRGKDDPSRETTIKLFETAFNAHPYRRPIIGTKESVASFEREDVLNFFNKHYVAENTTLVVSGDFEPAYAREKIEEQFGGFDGKSYERAERAQESEQNEIRSFVNARELKQSHLRVGYRIPEATHEDIPAIDVLSVIMGHGEASHLHRAIYRRRELVNSIRASASTPKDNGLLIVSASYQADDESRHETVIDSLIEEIYRFRLADVTEKELDRAKTIIESQEVYGQQTVEGQAMKLGKYKMVTGDPLYQDTYYNALRDVDIQDIRRVANKYLKPDNSAMVLQHPAGSVELDESFVEDIHNNKWASLDTSASESDVGTARSVDGDGFHRVELEDGPILVIQENRRVETFAMRAFARGGLRAETPSTAGISKLIANLVTKGSDERESTEISHLVESMAGSLSGFAGRNTMGLQMKGLSRFFGESFDIFADCLVNPTFPEAEFEREQYLHLERIKNRRDSLGKVNYDQFCSLFFGDHPYGLPSVGTPKSIGNIDREGLAEHYQNHVRSDRLVLSVVGDVDRSQVINLAEQNLVGTDSTTSANGDISDYESRNDVSVEIGELQKEQAFLTVGFDAPWIGDEDYYGLRVLNSILSGQGGRLFYELRDRQSLAYSVFARALLGLDASALMVHMGTSPSKLQKAIGGIRREIEKLREGDITQEEIDRAKQYIIGSHDIGLQKYSSRAKQMGLDELYGLGYRHLERFPDKIETVDQTELQHLVDTYLNPDKAAISVTKPPGTEMTEEIVKKAWRL